MLPSQLDESRGRRGRQAARLVRRRPQGAAGGDKRIRPGVAAVLDRGSLRLPPPPAGQGRQARAAGPRRPDRGRRRPGRTRHKFIATAPNHVWLTDITEHSTRQEKLYLCAVKDCYSNKIVGYSIDSRMKSGVAASALRNAIGLRSPAGTICHCGTGSQLRSKKVARILKEQRPARHDGAGRTLGRQRRYGELLDAAAKERPGHPTLEHPRGLTPGDRGLDRDQVQPTSPPTHPRQTHPGRV
jgi:transposase InsO family protein